MIQQGDGTEDVECTEIVYRALKKTWIDGNTVTAEAFIRRIQNGGQSSEAYVSMDRRKYSTARECRSKLKKMPSATSLHVGRARSLPFGLDVHPVPIRDEFEAITDPGHCALMNLPDPIDDYGNAEFVASQLARIARLMTAVDEEQEHQERRPA
jgi:hypothetical protein